MPSIGASLVFTEYQNIKKLTRVVEKTLIKNILSEEEDLRDPFVV